MSDLQELNEEVTEAKDEAISQEVVDAFNEGVEADLPADAIKVKMLTAGAHFTGVTSLYNRLMVDTGRAMSKEDKGKLVISSCVDEDLSTKEGFDSAVNAILEGKGDYEITDRSAAGLVRGYAKKNKLECYKAPKAEGKGRGRHGFKANLFDWMRQNPLATAEELKQLVHDFGTKNVLKDLPHYESIRQMVNDVANGKTPEKDPEFVAPESNTAAEILDAPSKQEAA